MNVFFFFFLSVFAAISNLSISKYRDQIILNGKVYNIWDHVLSSHINSEFRNKFN